MGACTFFAGSVACIQTGVLSTMHAQVFTINRFCVHLAYTLATRCAYALMYVQFVHLALENEDGRVQLGYEGTCCLAWGVIFDRRKDRDVACVFSICNAGGSVCGCMWVYTHTHVHTAQMGYRVIPGHRNWQIETVVWNLANFLHCALEAH